MKAIICTKYGPPEVLKQIDMPKPVPRNNEVLVGIHATSVTVGDVRIRGFQVPVSFWIPARIALGITKPKTAVLGSIYSGIVASVGKDVNTFKIGDKVFGSAGHNIGSYADYISIPENGCIGFVPKNFSFADAAAILWGGVTASFFLRQANIKKGRKVLIYGASGSVGSSAVQIAKHLGAEVTGVRSTGNLAMVLSLGADKVIDYKSTDFTKIGEKYDVIFDAVGKASISGTIKSLTPDGIYIHAVTTPGTEIRIRLGLISSRKKLIGGTFIPDKELINFLIDLADKKELKPVIDRVYPIEEIIEAHRYVDKGHKKGDVIITMNNDKSEEI